MAVVPMYNKCSKCGIQIKSADDTKLIPDRNGSIRTLCMTCYKEMYK